jgi:hypothetical protein
MRFLEDYDKYTLEGNPNWLISKDKNVLLYFVNGFELWKAWDAGNNATRVNVEGGVILRNIYVKEDCRRQGIFSSVMDQICIDFMIENLGLFLFPCHFEFDRCPFDNPKEAKVITLYEQDRKGLYNKYEELGFRKLKSAYYDMDRSYKTKITNTTISGENRKAQKDEIFAGIQMPDNMGHHWMGLASESLIPQEVFLDFAPDR